MSRIVEWVLNRRLGDARSEPELCATRRSDEEPTSPSVDDQDFLAAVNTSKNVVVATHVAWAGTSETRRRGLLGRQTLEAGEGMYIVPTQWIHMFGMKFPIDVAFLDGAGRVLWIHHGLKPNRLSRIVWRAEGALELPEGTLKRTGTTVGDIIELR